MVYNLVFKRRRLKKAALEVASRLRGSGAKAGDSQECSPHLYRAPPTFARTFNSPDAAAAASKALDAQPTGGASSRWLDLLKRSSLNK